MSEVENDLKNRQLEYVFENMEDAVCVTDKRGILLYANPAAGKLLNITGGPGEEKRIWEYIQFVEENDALVQLFIDAMLSGKQIKQSLVAYESAEGKKFRLRVSLKYTRESGGMFLVIMNDLTELFRVNTAFARYTSPEIAAYVLGSPEGEQRGGEVREVSILMSDLRDFTGMSDGLAPDDLVELLNHYFEEMVEIIEKWKGTVIEFLGDGIFVVFGAPREDPQHAGNAVRCALEMQDRMREVNEWNRKNRYPELQMGIGINSGKAVVGNIGTPRKMKYGCMGDTVNIAGRAESFTVGGQIYAAQNTCSLIGEELLTRGSHTFQAKGKRAPLTIYDVVGIGGSLKLPEQKGQIWKPLAAAECRTIVQLLKEKMVTGREIPAVVTCISEDHRYAVLQMEPDIEIMQNILLDLCGGLSAKIIRAEGQDYTICFTSKPDGFDAWVRSVTEPE